MFEQTYTPFQPVILSLLLAILPLAVLCIFLLSGWLKPPKAYVLTLLLTAILAAGVWKMPPSMIAGGILYGFLFALFPLFYMIWSSIFLFKVAEQCGYIQSIQSTLTTEEEGIEWKVLLVGFGLTAFIDSTAGFLAPIVIVTALLTQLGVPSVKSAIATLTSSAVPAVFGGVGVPILLLSQVTGQPLADVVLQNVLFDIIPAMIAPFITCIATCGWKSSVKLVSPILLGGASYAGVTLLSVFYISPSLGAIIGSVAYIAVILYLAKRKGVFVQTITIKAFMKSWWPFLLLTACVAVWNVPGIQSILKSLDRNWPIALLDKQVISHAPFGDGALSVVWKGQIVASSGTAIVLAAFITAVTSRMAIRTWFRLFVSSLYSMKIVALNLALITSVGFLLVYSGISGTLASPFQQLSSGYLLVAPLMGWLGTFLTGSNSASIALFGGLQSYAAQITHLPTSGIAASFAVAAVGGKMVSPQAVEAAVKASGLPAGSEAKLLRKIMGYSLLIPFLSFMVALVWKITAQF
ncbi:L-lactate permease [Aneurinibacillus sp. Ricciae_BoGa-3]|uniref:L-lactate permease n=1 Tax=Aneurinibacillus sp. Ricciae_BoGa-3 TaxID=3022697 RepID=UPI002341C935|nr:L-lactate permease [Aneurinibacillus sp. Ricciae_BoGa-3]WCK52566.1 L-lactate permease [Aneurinibacillus sp. Ricciae_BoGa-3]